MSVIESMDDVECSDEAGFERVASPAVENPVAESAIRWSRIGRLASGLLLVTYGGVLGAEAGAIVANHTPTHITVVPGLSGDATLVRSHSAIIKTGVLGEGQFPKLHRDIPGVGKVSIELRMEPVGVTDAIINVGNAIIDNPQKALEEPIVNAIAKHTRDDLEGFGLAGAGLGMAGLGAAKILRRRRGRKQQETIVEHRKHYEATVGNADPIIRETATYHQDKITQLEQPQQHKALKRLLAVGAVAVLLAGAQAAKPRRAHLSDKDMELVDPSLVTGIDNLAGARVTTQSALAGITGINQGLAKLEDTKAEIDGFYDNHIVPNLRKALDEWSQNPVNQLWLNDPDTETVMSYNSEHGSVPFATKIAPLVFSKVKPLVLIDTGNRTIDTTPFLNNYLVDLGANALEAAVQATGQQVVEVNGLGDRNSDPATAAALRAQTIPGPDGKPYHPNLILDAASGYVVTAMGLLIAGIPDPQLNTYGKSPMIDGKEVGPEDINVALAKAGDTLAKTACKLASQNQKRPILAVNRRELAYQTMLSGCATDVLTGEGPAGIYSYISSLPNLGRHAFIIAPSVSGIGDGESFTPYMKYVSTGMFVVERVNVKTNEIVAMSTLTIDPEANVSFPNLAPPPNNPYNSQVIINNINEYNPAALSANSAPLLYIRRAQ